MRRATRVVDAKAALRPPVAGGASEPRSVEADPIHVTLMLGHTRHPTAHTQHNPHSASRARHARAQPICLTQARPAAPSEQSRSRLPARTAAHHQQRDGSSTSACHSWLARPNLHDEEEPAHLRRVEEKSAVLLERRGGHPVPVRNSVLARPWHWHFGRRTCWAWPWLGLTFRYANPATLDMSTAQAR